MTILFLDIETLPTTDPDVIACFAAGIKAPATHKKPETIAAWLAENKDQATAEAVAKTSFDGLYGSIACICYAFDDGPIMSQSVCGVSEKDMLEDFYCSVVDDSGIPYHGGIASTQIVVCGHNIVGFDLPFLKHRSIIHGVKPPTGLLKAMSAKPWDSCIADTMTMWCSDSQT